MKPYYTIRIPYSDNPTEWHPTDKTGPFAVLVRGAFATKLAANRWAQKHLNGQPFEVVRIDTTLTESRLYV